MSISIAAFFSEPSLLTSSPNCLGGGFINPAGIKSGILAFVNGASCSVCRATESGLGISKGPLTPPSPAYESRTRAMKKGERENPRRED